PASDHVASRHRGGRSGWNQPLRIHRLATVYYGHDLDASGWRAKYEGSPRTLAGHGLHLHRSGLSDLPGTRCRAAQIAGLFHPPASSGAFRRSVGDSVRLMDVERLFPARCRLAATGTPSGWYTRSPDGEKSNRPRLGDWRVPDWALHRAVQRGCLPGRVEPAGAPTHRASGLWLSGLVQPRVCAAPGDYLDHRFGPSHVEPRGTLESAP